MKKKIKRKIKYIRLIVVLVSFVAIAIAGSYSFVMLRQNAQDEANKALADQGFGWKFPVAKFPITGPGDKLEGLLAFSSIRDPGGIPEGLPIRLKIPSIGVDSAIEDALITPDGRMDVPAGSVNVAWFALGPHPGKEGSAVIGGHFGIDNGVKFVFYDLDKLKVGDKVYIVDDKGDTLAFIVRDIKLFDRNADATTVFTSGDGKAHLNLITCEGVWNQVNDSYPDRRVVFTDAIPSEGAVVLNTVSPTIIKPTTPAAKVTTAEEVPTTTETTEPTEATSDPIVATNASAAQSPLLLAKSLYQTPLDGIITSLLLMSIVFIAVVIIRR